MKSQKVVIAGVGKHQTWSSIRRLQRTLIVSKDGLAHTRFFDTASLRHKEWCHTKAGVAETVSPTICMENENERS